MNARWSILVALALIIAGPALAAPVTITVDTGLFSPNVNPGDRCHWSVSPVAEWWNPNANEGAGEWQAIGGELAFGVDPQRWGAQGVNVTPDTPVNASIGGVFMGNFAVDESGDISTDYGHVFAVDNTTSTVTLKTHEVVVDMNRYNGSFWLNSVNWFPGTVNTQQFTYHLPAYTDNVYTIDTSAGKPGSTNATFRVNPDKDGNVEVLEAGSAGLDVIDGKLTFTNVREIQTVWTITTDDDTDTFGLSNGHDVITDIRRVWWWAGGGGDKNALATSIFCVPGTYEIGYVGIPGEWNVGAYAWEGGLRTFVVPEDPTVSIDETFTMKLPYNNAPGKFVTMTLAVSYVGIPEPMTMSLLAVGGLAMLKRRGRR